MSVISKLVASAQTTLGDARTAATIGAGTTGMSVAQMMGWLQANIGFIGAVAGVALTLATIWVQVLNARKANAELELLRRKLDQETA
ncbi:MAG: hypothetical protein ACRCXB_26210 [Aeromonadaceae bacterium]